MARIRTIKPEFWTDEKIVLLPYEARLLFIGIWNFADDYGFFWDEPTRIKMQVLPNDDVDVETLLDMLVSADLLNVYVSDNNEKRAYRVKHFEDHQKVDHPAKSKIKESASRKLAIPLSARRNLAVKYNCKPGSTIEANCYYCGFQGRIHWQKLSNGKPGSWVYFQGLEIDHLEPESQGGVGEATNLVLACRECNRSKHNKDLFEYVVNPREESRGLAPEWKGKEGKGRERKVKEKEYKKEKNPAHEKIKHLDSVYLTSREHETLITKYGREPTEKAIEILNNAIMSKGYKYKSHYHTIIGWPMKEVAGNGNKAPVMPKTYAQAKDAEKRALFATYNAQNEVSHGNAENNPDGNNKIAGRLPLPGPVS